MIWLLFKKHLKYNLIFLRNAFFCFILPVVLFFSCTNSLSKIISLFNFFNFNFQPNTFLTTVFSFFSIIFSFFLIISIVAYFVFFSYLCFNFLIQNEILNFWKKKEEISIPLFWWQKIILAANCIIFLFDPYSLFFLFLLFFINYELYSNKIYKKINLTNQEKPLAEKNILNNTLKLSKKMKILFFSFFIFIFLKFLLILDHIFMLILTNLPSILENNYNNVEALFNFNDLIFSPQILNNLKLFDFIFSIIILTISPSIIKEQIQLTINQLQTLSETYSFNEETLTFKPSSWFW